MLRDETKRFNGRGTYLSVSRGHSAGTSTECSRLENSSGQHCEDGDEEKISV